MTQKNLISRYCTTFQHPNIPHIWPSDDYDEDDLEEEEEDDVDHDDDDNEDEVG